MSSTRLALAAATIALVTAGCSAGVAANEPASNNADNADGTEGEYNPISISSTPPEGPLIPSDTEEAGRKTIVWQLFDGLVRIDENNSVVNEIAESIETDDAKNFTITIKDDRKFANGEPVTAQSFVDAWNWGAHIDNAQRAAGDYAVIEGFDAVHPTEEGGTATADTLSGLTVVDDNTFTVALSEPWSGFPNHLTSVVFLPLPQAFFDDTDAWIENPIGNGPYQLQKPIDESDGAYLEVNPEYVGSREPQNTGVYYRFYTDKDSAYQDVLANNLDITAPSPSGLLTAEQNFGDRFIVTENSGPNSTLTFAVNKGQWVGDKGVKLRQAISHAIDRQEIVDKVFNGLGSPSRDFTQQGLEGWSDSIPGSEVLDFDPDLAKKLYAEAGGLDGDSLNIYYNADGAHKEWIEAVAHQISQNLGITATASPITTFPEYLEKRDALEFDDGAWRASEIPFNPGLDDMLRNVYSKGGGASSGSGWESEEFEELLAKGRSSTNTEEATKYFNQAQELLFADLPAIPVFTASSAIVYSDQLDNVRSNRFGGTQVYAITKAGE